MLFFSCSDTPKTKYEVTNLIIDNQVKDSTRQFNPPLILIPNYRPLRSKPKPSSDVNVLIHSIDNSLPMECRFVGLGAEESLVYANYESLKRNASDSILLKLTYHKNPKLRVYAMWALTEKNKALAIKQLTRLSKDSKTLYFKCGCETAPESVNDLVTSQF